MIMRNHLDVKKQQLQLAKDKVKKAEKQIDKLEKDIHAIEFKGRAIKWESFYVVDISGNGTGACVREIIDYYDSISNGYYESGNYFIKEADGNKYATKVNNIFKIHKEDN